jgi:predicted nucleic acid-binding protein
VREIAFWDTSALVPLCVRQSTTANAIALYKTHGAVVWWTTPVEIASALARLVRMKRINATDCAKARKLADILSDSWSVIQPTDVVRAKALRLVDQHDLRAADSLQLAASLEWCEDVPKGRLFLTADERLREAALQVGFEAKQM